MKLTITLRDGAYFVVDSITAEEAQGLATQVQTALNANPRGTVKITYANGGMDLIAGQHIQSMKIHP